MTTRPDIAVLGAGSWGTTLALLLARNGHRVFLWGHDPARIATLVHERANARYLPGIVFPDNLIPRDDLPAIAREVKHVMVVVPSGAFRATLAAMAPQLAPDALVAWATKGLEPDTTKLLSEVAIEVLGASRVGGILSGPTFARELARGLPAALTVAARELAVADQIAEWLRSDRVRVYTNQDVVGVQLGGAIKNVMAIAAGISDGLGFGASARAALITRGLAEMSRLGVALGGAPETFMGLAGVGDLILTCTDDQSRNRRVGLGLGRGRTLGQIISGLGEVAEGVATAREIHALARRVGVDMPITEQVYRVLFEHLPPQAAVEALLKRGARPE